ncbi:MAG TPA: hypothetical protein VKV27_11730 [Solirubrobacteraceae bacterium]|nr:hypothetical protein [Solirubrobacteraceae bacterium]
MTFEHDRGGAAGARSARDAGIAFVRRANRWIVAIAIAIAGAVTAVTAHAFHPRTAAAAQTPTPTGASQGAAAGAGSATTSQGAGLSAPQTAVQQAAPAATTPVISGGS